MIVKTKQDIVKFANEFFVMHPNVKVDNECDKLKLTNELLAFGLDCIIIGKYEV